MGPFSLPESEIPFYFTNNLQNPSDVPVAITALFIVPEGRVVSELSTLGEREKEPFRIDGLNEEWTEVPALLTDPEGDQLLNSDIKELKAAIADGFLYILVDFYSLAEHPGFLLDIDLDGNREPEYVVEGGTESRWVIVNYPGGWLRSGESRSAAFEVIELRVPLSLLDPLIWKEYPETLPPDFDLEEVSGFYLRYRLTRSEEPRLLDETDWGYVETSE